MSGDTVTTDEFVQALNNGEFKPYIQPVVRASDLTMSGGELLTRWHMSAGKIISPACFIDSIESAGLLPLLTQKMMQQAVKGFSEKNTMLPQNFRFSVNVTPTLLTDDGFMAACLALAGNSRMRLVLELTELQPFDVDRLTERALGRLSDAGVEVALDDFGTGCSVLSYLKYFPVSYIKIDKIFIRDLLREDISRHIIGSVVDLAVRMGISTVAEGVETPAQVDCLQSLGVDYFQGYCFGKPERVSVFCRELSLNFLTEETKSGNEWSDEHNSYIYCG